MDALIGRYFRHKYRRILAESGDYYAAARNLRKQGIPLAIALLILVGGYEIERNLSGGGANRGQQAGALFVPSHWESYCSERGVSAVAQFACPSIRTVVHSTGTLWK